jgi:DNA-binding transcriptional LysR family regulator
VQTELIEGFLEVAQRGNLSQAAKALYLNQPTLTARLQTLERDLGQQLFQRTRRGMRLTESGRAFLPFAQRALRAIREGRQAVEDTRSGDFGRLVLGAAPAVSTYTLPDYMQRFAAAHPAVKIAVRTGHSEDVLEMVLREEVQLGFMRAIAHPDVESWPIQEEELVLVVARDHRFAGKRAVKPSDLSEEMMILFDRTSSYYELTQAFFLRLGIVVGGMMELDNIEAAKRMIERRLGIAFLPWSAVKRDVAARVLRVAKLSAAPRVTQTIVVARRRDLGPPSGAAAAFLALMRKPLPS